MSEARVRTAGGWRRVSVFFDDLPQPVAIALVVVVLLTIWQAVVSLGIVSSIILPSPVQVAEEFVTVLGQLFGDSFLGTQLWITVTEILAGFGIAVAVGFVIGLWVGLTRFGRKAIMPLFVLLEATPKIAFAPVFIAWFGFGMSSKIVLAAFLSVFPVIIGTVAGLEATDHDELRLFASLRARSRDVFWKLKLPRALPFIFAGLKIAVVASVTGTVAAEFIGGGIGFGEQIRVAGSRLALDRVFALIIFLSIIGLLLFSLVSWLQKRVVFWESPGTDGGLPGSATTKRKNK